MLERLTNGVLLATPHRVLPTAHPRASIIRFNAFGPNTVIAPHKAFCTPQRPARCALNSSTASVPKAPNNDGLRSQATCVRPRSPASRYTPVRMEEHMETTMRNLAEGRGSWDAEARRSRSATYRYESV